MFNLIIMDSFLFLNESVTKTNWKDFLQTPEHKSMQRWFIYFPSWIIFLKLLVVLTSVELVYSVFMDVSVLPFNVLASQMAINIIKYCFLCQKVCNLTFLKVYFQTYSKPTNHNQRDLLRRTVNKTKNKRSQLPCIWLICPLIWHRFLLIFMYWYLLYGHGLIHINKIQCN